jgi:glucan phosphoethanolaminetransferase (alkaline phosphatase superfamily)
MSPRSRAVYTLAFFALILSLAAGIPVALRGSWVWLGVGCAALSFLLGLTAIIRERAAAAPSAMRVVAMIACLLSLHLAVAAVHLA